MFPTPSPAIPKSTCASAYCPAERFSISRLRGAAPIRPTTARSRGPFAARNPCRFPRPIRNFSLNSATLTSTSDTNASLASLSPTMKRRFLFLGVLLLALSVQAQLTIDITTSGGRQIPIAVMPMAGDPSQHQAVSEVVAADLGRTGLFRMVNTAGVNPLPTEPSEVNFADWTARSAEALVIGKVEAVSEGRLEVRFRLFDVQKQGQLASYSYVVGPAQLRATAHR